MSKLLKKHRNRLVAGCVALLFGIGAIIAAVVLLARADSIDVHIGTVEELVAFREDVNSGINYAGMIVALSDHIDLSGEVWEPIGDTPENAFAGIFDGQNYKISNYTGTGGLFGYLTGTVRNTHLSNGNIISTLQFTGGIANHANGARIEACSVGVNISARQDFGADICIGGIVGYVTGTIIEECYTSPYGTIEGGRNSVAAGLGVDGGSAYVGGIVGRVDGVSSISNSYNQSFVYGARGGNGGFDVNDHLTESKPGNGGHSYTAGIAGFVASTTTVVANNRNIGLITGNRAGNGSHDGRTGSAHVAGNGGNSFTAGISNNNGDLLNNYNTGVIIGSTGGNGGHGACPESEGICSGGGNGGESHAAGIATGGKIVNCYNQGDISGQAGGKGGDCCSLENHDGIVGFNGKSGTAGIFSGIGTNNIVQNCYNSGSITGKGEIGSIISSGTIINCFTLEGMGTGTNGANVAAFDGSEFSADGGVPASMIYLSAALNEWIQTATPTPPQGYAYAVWSGVELPSFVSGTGIRTNKEAAYSLIELANELGTGIESEYDPVNVVSFINYVDNTLVPAVATSITQSHLDNLVANALAQLNRATPAVASEVPFVQVAAGGSHSAAIDANGQLWTWGANGHGQLGNGTLFDRSQPTIVDAFNSKKIVSVATGELFTLVIDEDGSVWAWGSNYWGQLGDSTIADTTTPSKIPQSMFNGQKVTAIAAGKQHSLALNASGELFAWGNNADGRLGTGDTVRRTYPTLIAGNWGSRKITQIAAGGSHSIAINDIGIIYSWGNNANGQLGDNSTISRNTPVMIPASKFANKKITAISAGLAHSIAITQDGEVYTWGLNQDSQLGDGTTTQRISPTLVDAFNQRIVAISAGRTHSVAIDEEGRMWSWGHNANGRLGEGTKTIRSIPVAVNFTKSIGDKAAFVSAGFDHSIAIDEMGRVWSWGSNRFGCLGDNTTIDRFVPSMVFYVIPPKPIATDVAESFLSLANFLRNSTEHGYTAASVDLFIEQIDAVLVPLLQSGNYTQEQINTAVSNVSGILQLEVAETKINIALDINGEIIDTLVYTLGGTVADAPENQTLDGHIFMGWYSSEGIRIDMSAWASFVKGLSEDTKLFARFVPYPVVNFVSGGDTIWTVGLEPNTDLSVHELPEPTRDNFEFGGWFAGTQEITNSNFEAFLTTVLSSATDATITAKWTPYVWISFETNGGTEISPVLIPQSANLATGKAEEPGHLWKPANPTRYGYIFDGWYTQSNFKGLFSFISSQQVPAQDTLLYAKWAPKKYTVTYDFNLGYHTNPQLKSIVVTHGAGYSFAVPMRANYDFVGWLSPDGKTLLTNEYGNNVDLVWEIEAEQGITVVAKWEKSTFEMKFDTGIEGLEVESVFQKYNDPITEIPQNPVHEFATFQGWYTKPNANGIMFDFSLMGMPSGGITLYAYWVSNASRLEALVNDMQEYRGAEVEEQELFANFLTALNDASTVDSTASIEEIQTAYTRLLTSATSLGFTGGSPVNAVPPPSEYDVWIITILAGLAFAAFFAVAGRAAVGIAKKK